MQVKPPGTYQHSMRTRPVGTCQPSMQAHAKGSSCNKQCWEQYRRLHKGTRPCQPHAHAAVWDSHPGAHPHKWIGFNKQPSSASLPPPSSLLCRHSTLTKSQHPLTALPAMQMCCSSGGKGQRTHKGTAALNLTPPGDIWSHVAPCHQFLTQRVTSYSKLIQ
jgi:hypothetical protein